ncbi:MAG: murein biosynthesis integral rane protein MurJ [Clostridia bacterium]|jgi:putative peptidoglycan lipid II flippase|nr:murein biosynthesis integral rane protein MurJ [Clostridia bacterium]
MRKTALILMLLTILSKVFGLARDITLSYFYGASNISDIYLISITIPMTIFAFIGTGISTGYIPMYSRIDKLDGTRQADSFTNNLVNGLLLICTLFIIVGGIFTDELVKAFASGFKGDTLLLAAKFTRVSLLGIYFTAIIYVFSGYLQMKGNYTIPALIGFPLNFFMILSIIASSHTNVIVLSIGSVVAAIAQFLLLLPFIYKKGFRYKFTFYLKNKYVRDMIIVAAPAIFGVSVNQINVLVDRTIASSLVVGGISALNYANKLNGFVQGIFVLSISTALFPMISKMAAGNNVSGLKRSVSEAIGGVNLLVIPITIGSMIFAEPVVKLLFGRGAFDAQAISMTSTALFYYSIGMIGYGLREVLSRTFYSLQDTKTPMYNAAIALIMNIVLNIILSRYMGIGGLALATSISALFCTGLLFISLHKKIGSFGLKNMSYSFIKILVASLLMGLIAKLSFNSLTNILSQNLSLLVAIAMGAISYFVIIYFMKIDDVDAAVSTLKRKLGQAQT